MHAHEIHAYEIHAYEMHAYESHAHEMQPILFTDNTSSSLDRICFPGQPHLKFRCQPPDGSVPSRAIDYLKFRG
jgi:hypothetical protein